MTNDQNILAKKTCSIAKIQILNLHLSIWN